MRKLKNHVDRILGNFDLPPPIWTLLLNSCYQVFVHVRGLYVPPNLICRYPHEICANIVPFPQVFWKVSLLSKYIESTKESLFQGPILNNLAEVDPNVNDPLRKM